MQTQKAGSRGAGYFGEFGFGGLETQEYAASQESPFVLYIQKAECTPSVPTA
jgi:hypothetical protein